MNLRDITPMILTFNEEDNLPRCLDGLKWAAEIVVVDSGSTDRTLSILAAEPRVRVVHRRFDNAACQCNYGLSEIRTDWVLSLDADYLVGEDWVREVEALRVDSTLRGFASGFEYWVLGGALKRSLYPPRTVLYRRDSAHYLQDGHTQRVRIEGGVASLRSVLRHDDRKDAQRWLANQHRYAGLEADMLLQRCWAELSLQDRLRRTAWAALPAVVFYTLLWQGMLWQGRRGWYYAWQRLIAESLLALAILERGVSRQACAETSDLP